MQVVHWTMTALALTLWGGLTYANLRIMLFPPKAADSHTPSCIPLLGGTLGAAGLLVCPLPQAAYWWWVPLLIDPGSGFYLLLAIRALWQERRGRPGPPMPHPDPESEHLRRALAGCLLGGAVGDALGLPYEGLSPARGQRLFPAVDRYHFLGPRGFCSDDTEHACMTAQALLATVGCSPSTQADAFARNLAWRLRFWLLGLPAGIGLATLKSILRLWVGFPPRTSGVRSAGNGPAMRAAVIGVWQAADLETMRALVMASTRLTHRDPRAEQGALAVALAAAWEATGRHPAGEGFVDRLERLLGEPPGEVLDMVRRAADSARRGEETVTFARAIGCQAGVSGYMPYSVAVAIQAWLRHPGDLETALTAVIRCGGDTDTVAAIAGGIIGAGVGRSGIPDRWLRHLWEWPRSTAWIEALSGCLVRARSGRVPPPPRLNPLQLMLRNLLFLVVVLGHGMRRMLPPY